ncbi:hypothetical protein QFW77_06410 [Luteimonas sp. RD2P54]|uniref:Uncharacterized protein n=1 Tax=Luteimonas endophytica TaxID=3042023 RepID=A0ABT6J725_9GAMM|nr:hypothetical protein [Luteimonas endophytica]MDH5822624.1 hypothetical protein [Luteimonas endophytica]
MDITRTLRLLPVLLAGLAAVPAWGQSTPQGPAPRGLTEIPDAELGAMRGRYTVGNDAVLWFGVSMVSTWQTQAGQTLQGQLNVGFDFSKGKPSVSFMPSVSITAADAPLSAPQGQRSVDTAGLDNVSGLVQGVQVAGDGNAARNLTTLTVRDGEAPSGGLEVGSAQASATGAGMSASAGFDGSAAQVLLQVDGHGIARQWIRPGSLGQSVALTGDGQAVSNQLHMELVRQSLPASAALDQGVAQAISLTRGLGGI